MKISVIIPCHNGERYLAQAIGSALDQTTPAHEVIVVDDASSDGSLALAHAFAQRLPSGVRVLAERFNSATRTRNMGAQTASGDALMFLDADDVLGPDVLRVLAAELQRGPGRIAACAWARLAEIGGRWVRQPPSCAPRMTGEDPLSAWLTGWYCPPCSVLWSRAAFEGAGRWDERAVVNQDGDLIMRALAYGIPLTESAAGIAFYRRTPGESLSGTRLTEAGLRSRLRTVRKIATLLEDQGTLTRQRRDAIRAALARIGTDAARRHPELTADARVLTTRFGGPRRFFTPPTRPRAAAETRTPTDDRGEVRDGLERSRTLLSGPPSPTTLAPSSGSGPAVTVIIPTCNRAPLLVRAIQSVLLQEWSDFELLVVDDASTDDTAAVVERIGDRRIRLIRQDRNQGVAAARNRGMREARGQFIAFLDSDDEWLPEKLSRQLQRFELGGEGVGLIYTGVESVHPDGRRRVACSTARGDVYRAMLEANVIHGGGSNVMIRREVIATAGFFDEHLPAIEDYDYWLRITRFFEVDVIEAPLIRYYDAPVPDRRSRAFRANIDARLVLFHRRLGEMRRLGVAHLFLLKTVRWILNSPAPDLAMARRLAARAVFEAPASRLALEALWRTIWQGRRPERPTRPPADGRPLCILMYSRVQPDHRGGVQSVIRRVAAQLERSGHRVVTAWTQPGMHPGVHDAVYSPPHVAFRGGMPTPRSLAGAVRATWRLVSACLRIQPDVVNFHFATAEGLTFIRLRRLFKFRVVVSVHGSDALRPKPEDRKHLPALLNAADAVTVVSQTTRAAVLSTGVDPGKVHLIPNGIDYAFWSSGEAKPFAARLPILLSVGRLHPVKGHDVLLRACARLVEHLPAVRVCIIGEGGFRGELEALARQLGIQSRVDLPGELDAEEVRAHMGAARCFVLPSRSEGLPLALLEAMAAGLPVVASGVGGVPEVLAGGVGWIVPPEDAAALSAVLLDALSAGLSSPHGLEEQVRAARERTSHYPAASADRAYEALLRHVATGGHRQQLINDPAASRVPSD